jgi:hypothetical protein
MDHRDQFFGELFNDEGTGADEIRLQRQLSFEERIIKRVFSECGIKMSGWGRFANECREITGHDKLNFSWFNSAFDRFPGVLCGKRIPRLHELTMVDLFKNPGKVKNRLCAAIANNAGKQNVDLERKFVFCFPIVRTMYCAHNIDTEDGDCPRVQWRLSMRPINNIRMIVEPTVSFFRTLGSDWYFD